jgi:hypothetical protein
MMIATFAVDMAFFELDMTKSGHFKTNKSLRLKAQHGFIVITIYRGVPPRYIRFDLKPTEFDV